jgi:hypothetical protein
MYPEKHSEPSYKQTNLHSYFVLSFYYNVIFSLFTYSNCDCNGGGDGDGAAIILLIFAVFFFVFGFIIGLFALSGYINEVIQKHISSIWKGQEAKKFRVVNFADPVYSDQLAIVASQQQAQRQNAASASAGAPASGASFNPSNGDGYINLDAAVPVAVAPVMAKTVDTFPTDAQSNQYYTSSTSQYYQPVDTRGSQYYQPNVTNSNTNYNQDVQYNNSYNNVSYNNQPPPYEQVPLSLNNGQGSNYVARQDLQFAPSQYQ